MKKAGPRGPVFLSKNCSDATRVGVDRLELLEFKAVPYYDFNVAGRLGTVRHRLEESVLSNLIFIEGSPASKPAHSRKSAAIEKKIRALDVLLEGDPREQRETFKHLKRALNAERGSGRKLFS